MDELSNQNEISSEVLDTQELHQNNTENIPLIDQSDDDLLLSIPPMHNGRNVCSRYWLEILLGFLVVFVFVILTFSGILFFKDTNISSILGQRCSDRSEKGKSCSIDKLETTLLIHLQPLSPVSVPKTNFTLSYTAVSHTSIITFSFKKSYSGYLGRLSIRDTVTNVELIEDGGFESGTMYAYCICDSDLQRTKPIAASYRQPGPYVCEINGFFSAVKLAQSVNTIRGHNYNVSFWLQSQSQYGATGNDVYVYMSSTSKPDVSALLRTKLITIFFILYIL